jgi:hypothetical protein
MTTKKLFLFVIILITSTSFVFSKGETDIKSRLNDNDLKLANLEKQIQELKDSNDALKNQLEEKESQFQLYEILLGKYENSRSSLFIEFSIFITVFSLIFGFLGYFTTFKPAKESKKEVDRLLERLQTNIDDLFSDYLIKNRNKLINTYLKVLLDRKESETSNAINYLNSVKHEGFNSEQLFKMRKIVLEEDYKYISQIFTYMIFTKDEIVENTCTEILKNKIDSLISYALIYFAKNEIHKHDNLVIEYLNKVPDKWGSNMASIRTASEDYLIKLWDDYYKELSIESLNKIAFMLQHYKGESLKRDNFVPGFLEKVKSSKFGQEKKKDELEFLFLT